MNYISRYRATVSCECESCYQEIAPGSAYYVLTNRADETKKCCPDCAAHYMAETLDAVFNAVYTTAEV